ncbi:MAG TPA: hypothetical protein VGI85_04850 [Chthoniobacterales bacterium]|jgi:hypothetical protein
MSNTANPKNAGIASELRARALALDDPELKAKAERVAEIVERAQNEAPASILDLPFRHLTASEKRRGIELEAMARQLLARHGKAVA